MTGFVYPVTLTPDETGGVVVTFPDFPFGVTEGEDEEDALARAADALESVLIALMSDRAEIPEPSRPEPGQRTVALPALAAAKLALYRAMRGAGLSKAALARRIGWHVTQVDRLLDLRHGSRLDQLETALAALGKTLVVEVRDAA